MGQQGRSGPAYTFYQDIDYRIYPKYSDKRLSKVVSLDQTPYQMKPD